MPEGLVRSGDFRNGTPVTLPLNFGTPITEPHSFGNPVPPTDATFNSNPVTWVPSPAHFGNVIAPATTPLAAPTFSPAGGAYTGAQSVTLTVDAHATATYYTTNGSAPTVLSTLYTGAITTVGSGTEVINAFSHGTGAYTDSTVATATYVITAVTPALVAATAQSGQQGNPPTTPITSPAIDTTGATILIVTVTNPDTSTIPTITGDTYGNVWTPCTNPGGTAYYPWMFYAASPVVGTGHTVSISGNTAFAQIAFSFAAFSGITTTSPFENQVVASSNTQSGPITPNFNDLIIAAVSGDNNFSAATPTINDSFATLPQNTGQGSNGANLGVAYLVAPSTSPTNPTWSGMGVGGRAVFAAQAVFAHA